MDTDVFIAVVHAEDGVRFTAAAGSRAEVVRRLTDYVRRHAAHALYAEHVRHVRALLARGELEGAVEVYFGLVGQRWDKEWLVTAAVPSDDRRDPAASVAAVAWVTNAVEAEAREAS